MTRVSLLPLEPDLHGEALQRVYDLSPSYWEMYHLPAPPADQARRDLETAGQDPTRTALGILVPNQPGDPDAGARLVGMIDFRRHWPAPAMVYVGLILVAEPFQRQGIASSAWRLLETWLAGEGGIRIARLGVEQFNPGGLRFFRRLGFALTGEAQRVKSGKRFVRLLYMEKDLTPVVERNQAQP